VYARIIDSAAVALLLMSTNPQPAYAILWTLSGVTFNDGGTASGWFVTDSTGFIQSNYDITTTSTVAAPGFPGFPGFTYTPSSSFIVTASTNASTIDISAIPSDDPADHDIELVFAVPLDGTTDRAQLSKTPPGFETTNLESRGTTAGHAALTIAPEPATLTVLGAGLAALAVARKRREAA